jgi:hypothetical protein
VDARHTDRHLAWEGCLNVRDLGGLPITGGGTTRWGAVVRADNPAYLTAAGWAALHASGVRTIVALRTDGVDDDDPDPALVPVDITTIEVALEDLRDEEFAQRWARTGLWGTPLYHGAALERWPERSAAAVAAVARAGPGGVVVSCGRGCDRTGFVSLLLLTLVGVGPDAIAADWELSVDRLRPRHPEYPDELQALLTGAGTTASTSIRDTLAAVDIEAVLSRGGLTGADLSALRARLGP